MIDKDLEECELCHTVTNIPHTYCKLRIAIARLWVKLIELKEKLLERFDR